MNQVIEVPLATPVRHTLFNEDRKVFPGFPESKGNLGMRVIMDELGLRVHVVARRAGSCARGH